MNYVFRFNTYAVFEDNWEPAKMCSEKSPHFLANLRVLKIVDA